jgi:surface polysaccharide O-acyltransferase-like enzyme
MNGRVWTALILIVLGVLLLLEAFGVMLPSRWWALLLLVPAVIAVFAAWRIYRRDGTVALASAAPFAGAVVLALLTLAILLDIAINWNVIGPIALILVGADMLRRRPRQRS